jgi:uncharacterized SAM-binding protein YcdF (DUF218 family)
MIWEIIYLATLIWIVAYGTFLEVRAQARVTLLGCAATAVAWLCAGAVVVPSVFSLISLGPPALTKAAGVYVVAWFFVLTIWPSPLLTERTPNCDE